MHGPIAPFQLTEFTCPVEGVDDPEAPLPRHVLEPLLGTHVVVGVEPGQLAHQQGMGEAVPRRTEVPHGRRGGAQLHEGLAGHGRQVGRVAMFGGQVPGHGPLF